MNDILILSVMEVLKGDGKLNLLLHKTHRGDNQAIDWHVLEICDELDLRVEQGNKPFPFKSNF